MEIDNFYDILNSATKQITKHNVLIISGDFNAHLGIQDGFMFSLHEVSNRNGIFLEDYILENNLLCLNTYYQKRKGQLWTHKSPNGNKVQLDYIMNNRKWKNSSKDCRAYGSFESIASDHRIVSAHLKLSLRSNKKKTIKTPIYDWTTLKNPDIQKKVYLRSLKKV